MGVTVFMVGLCSFPLLPWDLVGEQGACDRWEPVWLDGSGAQPLALVCALAVWEERGRRALFPSRLSGAGRLFFGALIPFLRETAQPSAPPPSLAELPQEPVLTRVGATTNEGAAGQAGNDAY